MPHFTTADKCKLFYEIRNTDDAKPVIVFLNGFTQTTVYWYGRVPTFLKHFTILLYDARGQGQSGLGRSKPTLGQHVSDLAELLAHLSIDRADLVGLSHGARVALAFATDRPKAVGRLVLCGLGARDTGKTKLVVDQWYAILETGDPAAMAETILPSIFGKMFIDRHREILTDIATAVVERNDPASLLAQLKTLPDYPAPESMQPAGNIDCLVLGGEGDPLILPAEAQELARHLGAHHETLSGVGHSLPVEAPQRFDRLILEFLLGPSSHS